MTDVHGPADELAPAAEKRHTGCRGHQKIEYGTVELPREVGTERRARCGAVRACTARARDDRLMAHG